MARKPDDEALHNLGKMLVSIREDHWWHVDQPLDIPVWQLKQMLHDVKDVPGKQRGAAFYFLVNNTIKAMEASHGK